MVDLPFHAVVNVDVVFLLFTLHASSVSFKRSLSPVAFDSVSVFKALTNFLVCCLIKNGVLL